MLLEYTQLKSHQVITECKMKKSVMSPRNKIRSSCIVTPSNQDESAKRNTQDPAKDWNTGKMVLQGNEKYISETLKNWCFTILETTE